MVPGTAGWCRVQITDLHLRLAEDKWKSRLDKTAKENYNEMGLLSLSVVAYTRKNGQLAIDM